MTIDTTRRGFLAGLMGISVIAVLPHAATIAEAAPVIDPFKVDAPSGITYQWVRSMLMGEPDPQNVQARLDNGWSFVAPAEHPTVIAMDIQEAIAGGGLILMQKETSLVQAQNRADLQKLKHWPPPNIVYGPENVTNEDGLFEDHTRRYGDVRINELDQPEYRQDDGTWISQAELIKRQA